MSQKEKKYCRFSPRFHYGFFDRSPRIICDVRLTLTISNTNTEITTTQRSVRVTYRIIAVIYKKSIGSTYKERLRRCLMILPVT